MKLDVATTLYTGLLFILCILWYFFGIKEMRGIGYILILFSGGLLGLIIGMFLPGDTYESLEVYRTIYTNPNIPYLNQTFVLYSDEIYYYYYYEAKDGFKRTKVKICETSIKKSNSFEEPNISLIKIEYINEGFIKRESEYYLNRFVLCIPNNSIIKSK